MSSASQLKGKIMTTIAITGATGQLGRLAIAALKSRDPKANIIALVRNTAADVGAPTRAFDYKNLDASALTGVDVLVLISSSDFDDRIGQHKNVINAAKSAGVGRIIYTSILSGAANPMILAQDHIATEAAIVASKIPATILRNGWYTENYTGSLGGSVAAGAMIGASGKGRISSAARADYADAIAVVALDKSHVGLTYELAGDTAHTMDDFAAEVSRLLGKTIPYNDLPAAAYQEILQSFGLPEGVAFVFADSDIQAKSGALFNDSKTLSKLIGRPTPPISGPIKVALDAL
jgi:NAD(P)H dehydrogenase (quinone)